jgi:hypothetical protein|tara:strand:+ start:18902 stop:19180 length:279 start_codon:yes stop_codon:yes gene_type:complete
MYQSIFFSLDGEYITDATGQKSIDGVWDLVNNFGSRWIFYPLPFVIIDKNGVSDNQLIISACDGFKFLEGCSIKTAQKYIKDNAEGIAQMLK